MELQRDHVPERLRESQRLVADLERQQQVAARREHPAELRKRHRQQVIRHMHRRVIGDHAGEDAVGQVQRQHRAHLEPHVRVSAPRHREHPRRQIDPEHVKPQVSQVRGHPPLATPDVGDRPRSVGPDQFGEHAQHCPFPGLRHQLVPDVLGILDRQRVV